MLNPKQYLNRNSQLDYHRKTTENERQREILKPFRGEKMRERLLKWNKKN